MPHSLKIRDAMHASGRSWFEIKAQDDSADILIYDYIGWGGVTAADFAKALQGVTAKQITVRLNTPGGDVFDGLAIFNSLKDHGAQIHVKVDGVAASIGSIIAMAGQTITMGESAFLMIHNPWAMTIGNAGDMRQMAETLDKIGGSLASVYSARAKVTMAEAQAWMDAETWFTAEEAKNVGLADEIQGSAKAALSFDLSGYAKVPKALTDKPTPTVVEDGERDGFKNWKLSETALRMQKRLMLVQRGELSSAA